MADRSSRPSRGSTVRIDQGLDEREIETEWWFVPGSKVLLGSWPFPFSPVLVFLILPYCFPLPLLPFYPMSFFFGVLFWLELSQCSFPYFDRVARENKMNILWGETLVGIYMKFSIGTGLVILEIMILKFETDVLVGLLHSYLEAEINGFQSSNPLMALEEKGCTITWIKFFFEDY